MFMQTVRRVVDYARAPLLLIALLALYVALYHALGLPPPDELFRSASTVFHDKHHLLVFFGALGEGILIVNMYYPGSAMVLLGVALSAGNPAEAATLVGIIAATFWVTSLANYLLGKYGWHSALVAFGMKRPLLRTQSSVVSKGLVSTFPMFIHPNLSALVATSCGILGVPFRRFALFSLGATVFWNFLWGLCVYVYGREIVEQATMPTLIALLALWAAVQVARAILTKEDTDELEG